MNITINEQNSLFLIGLWGLNTFKACGRILKFLQICIISSMFAVTPALAQDDETAESVDTGVEETAKSDEPETTEMEEMVVTGQRAQMMSAQDFKRSSEQIVDSIFSDDIGSLPDRSVAETLQRVPGVTIDRFISSGDPEHVGGEGGGVAVRGLTQVRSEINGRDGVTANGGRSLSFEDVPPELLAGVEVFKNPSADMIEGGLGGTVNLRTRMPLDIEDRLIAFTVTQSHQTLIEETSPEASFLFSDRWDTGMGEVGFLFDIAYSESRTRVDSMLNRPYFPYDRDGDTVNDSYIPRGADWRTVRTDRTREGFYTAFQWKPTDDTEYYLTAFRSKYVYNWDEDAFFVDNDPYTVVASADSVYDENGTFLSGRLTDPTNGGINMGSDVRFSDRTSITTDISTGFEVQLDSNWFLSTDIQLVDATTEGLDSTIAAGVLNPYIDLDLSGGGPASVVTDTDYLADINNYHLAFTMDHQDDNKAKQMSWRGDAEYTFDDSVLKSVKFGVRYTDRESVNIDTGYNWVAVFQPWMRSDDWPAPFPAGATLPNLATQGYADQAHFNDFSNFYRGDIPVPGVLIAPDRSLAAGYPQSYIDIHNSAQAFYAPGTVAPYSPTLIQPAHSNFQDETTNSLYGLLRFGWDDIGVDGNIGLRLIETKNVASGWYLFNPDAQAGVNVMAIIGGDPLPNAVDNTYRNTLPSLNLRWEMMDGLIGRFAWSKAISRPNFTDMKSYLQLNAPRNGGAMAGSDDINDYSGNAQGGNPNLDPLEAKQWDLSLEWYYSDIGSTWFNLFSKNIDGFIRNQISLETINGFEYAITRPMNQDKAKIDGWELGWRHFFDFGFGMEASYTKIDSETRSSLEAFIPQDTDGNTYDPNSLPYEGLSKSAYNVIFMYEDNLLSARLAYTWRDEWFVTQGPTGFNGNNNGIPWSIPVYQEDYGQWDGSIFFNITEQLSVGLEANNLLNEEIYLQGRQLNPTHDAKAFSVQDTRYALTLRGKF